MKLNCKLHQIAKAIRKANGKNETIEANNFHKEIGKLCYIDDNVNGFIPTYEGGEVVPTLEPIIIKGNQYVKDDLIIRGDKAIPRTFVNRELLNEYYGGHVADVARSYHLAKTNGDVVFRYSQTKGIWDTSNGLLTDEEGRCYIDCSGFVSLVLRGIEFKDTPYYLAKGIPHRHLRDYGLDNTIISDLASKSKHKWANTYFDKQVDPTLKDIGLCKYYSIRNASQLCEYYHTNGQIIHEFKKSPSTIPSGLKPGDLLFWSKESAGEHQKDRFKEISHVGIVARDTTKFYHVTGYSDERVTETIFCQNILDKLSEMSFVIRPNYVPIDNSTPKGMNLLNDYAFDSCQISASTTLNGVLFAPQTEGGFSVERTKTSTTNTTFYLVKSDNFLTLDKGSYKLSGCPINNSASTTPSVLDWGLAVKRVDNGVNIAWDKGEGATFTLSEKTKVYIYFFVSKSVDTESALICKPKLERMS